MISTRRLKSRTTKPTKGSQPVLECRFAFVEAQQERSFAQRAEAVGLRYTAGPRLEAINISNGRPVTIAVYRSAGQS